MCSSNLQRFSLEDSDQLGKIGQLNKESRMLETARWQHAGDMLLVHDYLSTLSTVFSSMMPNSHDIVIKASISS